MPGTFSLLPRRTGTTATNPYQSIVATPVTNPYPVGQLPPPPTNYQLPPPPSVPQLPAQQNTFLPMLTGLLQQYQNYNALPNLTEAQKALLAQMTAGETSTAELTFRDAFNKAIADLYGRGVERSTIATDATGRLASEKANTLAQIMANASSRELGLQQYIGQQGLSALGAQGQLAGTGATLEQNAYNSMVNAILQRAGLETQQYGMQTGNTLQQQGLTLQQQQLAQQQNLAQQSFLQQLLSGFLSGQYNFGNLSQQSQTSGSGAGGVGGFGTTSSNNIYSWLMPLFQMLGINLPYGTGSSLPAGYSFGR